MTVTNGFYWSNGGGVHFAICRRNAVFSSEVSSPMIADVNGDGKKEVVTAWKIDPDSTSNDQDFNPFINDIWGSGEWGTVGETWSGGVVFFDAATGAKQYVYHIQQLVESGLALGHADTNKPARNLCAERQRQRGRVRQNQTARSLRQRKFARAIREKFAGHQRLVRNWRGCFHGGSRWRWAERSARANDAIHSALAAERNDSR